MVFNRNLYQAAPEIDIPLGVNTGEGCHSVLPLSIIECFILSGSPPKNLQFFRQIAAVF